MTQLDLLKWNQWLQPLKLKQRMIVLYFMTWLNLLSTNFSSYTHALKMSKMVQEFWSCRAAEWASVSGNGHETDFATVLVVLSRKAIKCWFSGGEVKVSYVAKTPGDQANWSPFKRIAVCCGFCPIDAFLLGSAQASVCYPSAFLADECWSPGSSCCSWAPHCSWAWIFW